MASYNKVLLMGNLTRDVELKHIASGQAVAQLGLAVNRRFKTKDGEEREEVTFVDCEAWGRQAEVIHQYFSKGKPIFVEGRLKLDSWEDKEGKKQSKLRVVIEEFQFVGGRDGGGEGGGGGRSGGRSRGGDEEYAPSTPSASPGRSAPRGSGGGGGHVAPDDNDIPF